MESRKESLAHTMHTVSDQTSWKFFAHPWNVRATFTPIDFSDIVVAHVVTHPQRSA